MSDFKILENKIEKTLNLFIEDLNNIQANKVSVNILKQIAVTDEEGHKINLLEIGLARTINNTTLGIKPWDSSQNQIIEKALKKANIGANIGSAEGEIQIIFPALTEERRKEIAKSLTTFALNTKNSIRNIRHDFLKDNKPNSKEEEIKLNKEVQKIIDKFNDKIDELTEKKQKEIMKI